MLSKNKKISNKSKKKKISNKSKKKKIEDIVEVSLKGWRYRVREKDLNRIIKREYKKGTRKVIALNELGYQVHATYDVNKLMKKINNGNNKLLLQYDRWYNFW